jgi:hypothetical protein
MTFAIGNAYGPGLLTVFGGSFAIDAYFGDTRLFYAGVRLGAVGDAGGVLAMADVDFGVRPRVELGGNMAVSFIAGGGLGLGLLIPYVAPLFHMPLRLGIGFDAGPFTAELVGGPALYAAKGALGAFESVAEIGVRF